MSDEPTDSGASTPPDVLYIGALGRSGSTLLNLLLSAVPGFFAAGELRYIWDRGLDQNQLCGCGQAFLSCPFWTEVGQEAFGGWGEVDAKAMTTLDRSLNRNRNVPGMMRLTAKQRSKLRTYRGVLGDLYAAIKTVAECQVIVDSSKTPAFALILSGLDDLDVAVLHLVRDPRGVAYSRTKIVQRPEIQNSEIQMGRFTPTRTALMWLYFNVLLEWLRARGVTTTRLSYESLAADPRTELKELLRTVGASSQIADLPPLEGGGIELATNHTVSGNPMRFDRGFVPIRRDDQWRQKLPRRQRIAVSAITAPLLARYGYPLTVRRNGPPPG